MACLELVGSHPASPAAYRMGSQQSGLILLLCHCRERYSV